MIDSNAMVGIRRFLLVFAFYQGLPMVRGAASKFRYPLAVSTGSAETEFGGVAEDNPCSTDAFTVHPALPYSPIYLTGSEKSFLKLNLGRGKVISNQWSMSMFVYSVAPHYGTIFHYVCTATSDVTLVKLYTKEIKLTLNNTHMMFKMVTTLNIEYSIEIPSIITTESWIPIAIAYDYSNGEFTLMTENNKFYEETDAPDTLKNVHIGQPATITLGRSSVNPSTPFQGSIVCFGVYDTKISDNNFNSLLDECQPSNWAVVPPTVSVPTTASSPTDTFNGYFSYAARHSKPQTSDAPLRSFQTKSKLYCGHACSVIENCQSFTYNKQSEVCTSYDTYFQTLVTETGTQYYKRRFALSC